MLSLFLIVAVAASPLVSSSGNYRQGRALRLHVYDDKNINTNNLDIADGPKTLTACHLHCVENEKCVSYFYLSHNLTCRLHSIAFQNTSHAVDLAGSAYYQIYEDWCLPSDGHILYRPQRVCYKFYTNLKYNYNDAMAFCQGKSEELLTVRNADKHGQIIEFLKDFYKGYHVPFSEFSKFFISANNNTGELLWPDNTPVVYTDFPPGEPSHENENCVTLLHLFWFRWNDAPCDSLSDIICEHYEP
ncbi:hypothetical protein SNE40_022672 [Patella caerulea]|uniref:C-type lectin domain-containing protein n=1 Tax=Patella caerulea TaxID=87958 RepID=A0AAN8G4K1_PATCE